METIDKVRTTSFQSQELIARVDAAFKAIHVMGSYNPSAPLVVKRAVYEELMDVLRLAEKE
jgi:hypothetical protein